MKQAGKKLHILALALAILVMCLCSGCNRLFGDDYLSVRQHYDPYAYKEETAPTESETETERETLIQSVSSYYEMLGLLRRFVTEGVEHGQFLLTESYAGDREEALSEAFVAMRTEDPLGAYAIDYMEYEHTQQAEGWLVTVDAVYRRSTSEIEAIRSVRGNDRAMELITETLDQLGASITLRISGYTDEDLRERVQRYCLEHPNKMVQTPDISLAIYPQSGNVRVVELHFSYNADRETLRGMQSEADSVLASAERYAQYAPDAATKLSLIYSYLTSRFPYVEDGQSGSVYRLLCEGVGNSESVAAVTYYLCQKLGLDCQIVQGTRERTYLIQQPDGTEETVEIGQEDDVYVWNLICIDGLYYHLDLQQDALERLRTFRLRLDEEMIGYSWDREAYPPCDGIQPEPQETE